MELLKDYLDDGEILDGVEQWLDTDEMENMVQYICKINDIKL